jgi:two-component system nitrate/nitrite response regulator NarL
MAVMNKVPTLVIDPHHLCRQRLVRQLDKTRYHVIAEYDSVEEALRSPPPGVAPQLIVLDPCCENMKSLARLRDMMPNAFLAALTSNMDGNSFFYFGAEPLFHGHLSKHVEVSELPSALDRIMKGEILRPPAMRSGIYTDMAPTALEGLTEHDAEILRRLLNGDSNSMIAKHLSLSESIIRASVRQLFRKIRATKFSSSAQMNKKQADC